MICVLDEIEDTTGLMERFMEIIRDFHLSNLRSILQFKEKILSPIPLILNRILDSCISLRLDYHSFSLVGRWWIDLHSHPQCAYGLDNSKFHNFIDNINKMMNGVLLHEYLKHLHQQVYVTDEEISIILIAMGFAGDLTDEQEHVIVKNLNHYLADLQEDYE